MHTLNRILPVSIILTIIVLTHTAPIHAAFQNPTCPLDTDTVTYSDPTGNTCHSAKDIKNNTGFNIVNSSSSNNTCGRVACPGDNSNTYRHGHTCVIKAASGLCYAGYGSSGYNSVNCVKDPLVIASVPCPKPIDLTAQVIDDAGTPISGITITVAYANAPPGAAAGQTTTATTNPVGKAVISNLLYSGDHFTIIPSSPLYIFEPNQYGNTRNLGILEVNTFWSCGMALGDGTTNDPCLFIAHPVGTTVTVPGSCNDCLARGTGGATFYCSNAVSGQNICSPQSFNPYRCTFCQRPTQSPVVYTCSSLNGICKTPNSCINGQELDAGQLDCGTGSTCCGPKPYAPNLSLTLIVFGVLAAIGLLF